MIDKVEINISKTIKNTADAMSKVTKSALQNNSNLKPYIKGKKTSTQFSFKLRNSSKDDILASANRKIINYLFSKNATILEVAINNAMKNAVIGIVGAGSPDVKILGRSLGNARATVPLEQSSFISYTKSKSGAGEIGLPDPNESIRNLKIALAQCINVDVVVRNTGPQVKFIFDQQKLLKLTPHPGNFDGSNLSNFYSWLSLVTGPNLVKTIYGYSLVRASDIYNQLTLLHNNRGFYTKKEQRSLKALNGLLRISRTKAYAREDAGLMLSNRRKGKRSSAEFAGGKNEDYSPSHTFPNFWDKFWINTKFDLAIWSRRIMRAAVRELLRK